MMKIVTKEIDNMVKDQSAFGKERSYNPFIIMECFHWINDEKEEREKNVLYLKTYMSKAYKMKGNFAWSQTFEHII